MFKGTYDDQVERLGRVGGFAPGNYNNKCGTCGEMFVGDKRAYACLSCAVNAKIASIQDERRDVQRALGWLYAWIPKKWGLNRAMWRHIIPSSAREHVEREAKLAAQQVNQSDWEPIETAPKDGTVIEAAHNRTENGMLCEPYYTQWGVGKEHLIYFGGTPTHHVVNGGKPWWLNREGIKLVPTPTHWREVAH